MPTQDLPSIEELPRSASSESSISLERAQSSASLSSVSTNDNVLDIPVHGLIISNAPVVDINQIALPREPSLDELLRQVSGSTELRLLTEVHLKIMSSMVCIQRLDVFLPNLIALNLDGSMLNSLRDLGSNLMVKYLNVSRCGLKSLDGTNGLTTLVHLVADDNRITSVGHLCNLPDLQKLSLRRNQIKDIGTVSFMTLCEELRDIDLSGNSVCKISDYRNAVKMAIPNLMILDDVPFYETIAEPALSSSEYSSSTISSSEPNAASSGESARDQVINYRIIRPASSQIISHVEVSLTEEAIQRPSTAESYKKSLLSLTSGAPISGNIISARRRRNSTLKQRKKSAWTSRSVSGAGSSTSSSSLSSFEAHPQVTEFPKMIPQLSVELELGVIGVQPSSNAGSADTERLLNGSEAAEDTFKLLAASRKWRESARKTREDTQFSDCEKF